MDGHSRTRTVNVMQSTPGTLLLAQRNILYEAAGDKYLIVNQWTTCRHGDYYAGAFERCATRTLLASSLLAHLIKFLLGYRAIKLLSYLYSNTSVIPSVMY